MSDPRYDQPPLRETPIEAQRRLEVQSNNAMWGWIAGAVVLALVLLFIFARTPDSTTATNTAPQTPPATTGMAPPREATPPREAAPPVAPPAPSTAPSSPSPNSEPPAAR